MKKSAIVICGLALLALLLASVPAEALIPCDSCAEPNQVTCIALEPCPRVPLHTTCQVWITNNCPILLFQSAEDTFLLSLANLP